MAERVAPSRFHEHGWHVIRDDAAATHFATRSFANGVELVAAIAGLTATSDRTPDVDLRADGVTVRLGTNGPGPSAEDLDLAERISAAAKELGVPSTSTDRSECRSPSTRS